VLFSFASVIRDLAILVKSVTRELLAAALEKEAPGYVRKIRDVNRRSDKT